MIPDRRWLSKITELWIMISLQSHPWTQYSRGHPAKAFRHIFLLKLVTILQPLSLPKVSSPKAKH